MRTESQKNSLSIGASVPRCDAYEKVTGATKFASDYYAEDLVWAGVKRAGFPHGKIVSMNLQEVSRFPGIIKILTYKDVPGHNRQGVVRKDQPVLADDKVRHCGDAVALILAESRAALESALNALRIDFSSVPGIFDVEDALLENSPKVHEDNPTGNILLDAHLETGLGIAAENECDQLVEACFETPMQEHAYLETECGWAVYKNNNLELVCSTQTPFRDRMETAEVLRLSPDRVRVIVPYVGGAFGGKDGVTVQTLLGLAAINVPGKPVKMWWSREESFIAGTKRHAARMYYKLGAKSDGKLHFLQLRLYLDTGPYDHLGGVVLTLAVEHAGGPYIIPNAKVDAWAVYTNNPIGGAFRGFGVPQVTAGIEQCIDLLAEKLGLDPLFLRMKNAVNAGDKLYVGKTLRNSVGITECLKTLSLNPDYKNSRAWKNAAPVGKKRGVGISSVMQGCGYGPVVPDVANAKVELSPTGKILVYSGVVDMGQGNAATYIQIAGSILNQSFENLELVLPDTGKTLPSGSASASRCTYTFGNALISACLDLKKRLQQRASDFLMANDPDRITLIPGRIKDLKNGMEFPLSKLASYLSESERVSVSRFQAPQAPDDLGIPDAVRLHGLPHEIFSFGAHAAFVEIDMISGAISVRNYLAITEAGNVLNPQVYEQQVHGAVAQGIGFALMENFQVQQGRALTTNLFTYIVPTSPDLPDIKCIPVTVFENTGPFGLKGVGEVAMNGPLPAISNAVADALGSRIYQYPITAEKILLNQEPNVNAY